MIGFIKKILIIFITLIILISCKEEFKYPKARNYAYTDNFSKGPISLEMKVDYTEISIAGNITVLLEGKASDGWKPSFTDLLEQLDKFTVVSVSDTPSRLDNDGSIGVSRTVILKPFLSGEYEIPSLSLNYIDENESKGILLSTPVSINVTSLLPENTENIQLKEIQEPNTFNYWKMIIIASIVLTLLGRIFLVNLLTRKRKKRDSREYPPLKEAFTKLTPSFLKKKLLSGREKI